MFKISEADPGIDLTQLNRNDQNNVNIDDTAVLKEPLNLNEIQGKPLEEESVAKDEDMDFPDAKEKRGKKGILLETF